MGRQAKHNWKNLFLEYNRGRYKSVAEFARAKGLNPVAVRREFKKFDAAERDPKTEQNETKKQNKTKQKTGAKKETKQKLHPWEKLKQQFTDWPEEKLQAYLVQLDTRKVELEDIPFEELTPDEVKELGRVRQERRAILSDPDPDVMCHAHNRDGSTCGNPAERGKRVCWNHGGAPGSGGQPGSKNALKTGEHETFWSDALTPEQTQVLKRIDVDPIIQIDDDIRLYSLREREMLLRIRKITEGLTDKQRRVLQERKKIKEAITVHDEKTGETKVVTMPRDELVVTELEETEFRPIDDIIRLEEALTRVQDKKVKALKTKYELLGVKERELRIEKLKAEVDKINGTGPGDGNTWADLVAGDDES